MKLFPEPQDPPPQSIIAKVKDPFIRAAYMLAIRTVVDWIWVGRPKQ